ncbi:hypothetical protein [Streptomyces sp. ID05-04B]|uniref:hypothetical protein n=1 Tax=Streptomyces sp. ID05-04B TaxID=3028661 RepID=UPI0029CA90E6|nr:hypothetical protein [Streptomyces sp. ID05-04B]
MERTVMYDYVIAGAGSAGCVLAERLSREPAVRVLDQLVDTGDAFGLRPVPDVNEDDGERIGYAMATVRAGPRSGRRDGRAAARAGRRPCGWWTPPSCRRRCPGTSTGR